MDERVRPLLLTLAKRDSRTSGAPAYAGAPLALDDSPRVIDGVHLPERSGAFRVTLADGRIATVEPTTSPASERLLLPGFADLHLHADRAFLRGPRRASSLADAVAMSSELRSVQSRDDFRRRARRLFERAVSSGTVRVRSHVDVDDGVDLRAVAGVVAARADLSRRLRVEIVAFANAALDPATARGRGRLEAALAGGADLLGGAPALHPDPSASLDALLDLCSAHGVGADLHIDEHLDRRRFLLEHLADGVISRGLEGRVTASHCCALVALPPAVVRRTLSKLVAAKMTIITLPSQNLFLQDRSDATPARRGVTLVRELVDAGVPVRLGSDNVQDVFYPYGDADLLETAFVASLATHLEDERVLLAAIADGRGVPRAGEAADLVVVEGSSLREALARKPDRRIVLNAGRVVSLGRAPRRGD